MGELKKLAQETASYKKPKGDTTSRPCQHVHCQCWDGKFMCKDCSPIKEISEPERVRNELAMMQQLGNEDFSEPADSVNRGTTISFLLALCETFNLYDITTAEVLREYVIPMTFGNRCRFVDLDAMRRSGVVGTASTFISHTWQGSFGGLIAALIDGGADLNRIVWVDIFAVRQWPTTKPDLKFEEVIERVSTLMIVCPNLKEIEKIWQFRYDLSRLPDSVRGKIPFLRVWCLYELVYAAKSRKKIVMKGGSCSLSESEGSRTIHFDSNQNMLKYMSPVIDVEKAEATVAADKEMILTKIHEFKDDAGVGEMTGLVAFNNRVRGIVTGSAEACKHPELQCALCGDPSAIFKVRERPADFIMAIAAGGYLDLLSGNANPLKLQPGHLSLIHNILVRSNIVIKITTSNIS